MFTKIFNVLIAENTTDFLVASRPEYLQDDKAYRQSSHDKISLKDAVNYLLEHVTLEKRNTLVKDRHLDDYDDYDDVEDDEGIGV